MRLLKIIIFLVVFSPIIVLNVWGFRTTMWMQNITKPAASPEAAGTGDAKFVAIPQRPVSPWEWFSNKMSVSKTFNRDKLNDSRSVSFSSFLTWEDLLQDGEATPEDAYLLLYASARGPRYMNRFCAEVLTTIGTRCIVGSASAEDQDNGSIKLSAQLYYTPDYETGTPQSKTGGQLHTPYYRFPRRDSSSKSSANTLENRAAYIKQTKNLCRHLKLKFGNCVIKSIDFSVRQLRDQQPNSMPKNTPSEVISVSARFSIFSPARRSDIRDYIAAQMEE